MSASRIQDSWVDLYWLPLGANGSDVVRLSGRLYEWLAAHRAGRAPLDLYHSALKVNLDGATHVIEVAPVWSRPEAERGVVAEGAVGSESLGLSRWFRYEVRCWRDGVLPDEEAAVDSPVRLSTDAVRAVALLDLVRRVPTPVWGRDELGTGEMWNSNSVVAWLVASTGETVPGPPTGGRAPGWVAGLALARSGTIAGLSGAGPSAAASRRAIRDVRTDGAVRDLRPRKSVRASLPPTPVRRLREGRRPSCTSRLHEEKHGELLLDHTQAHPVRDA